jgi:hypothetical protein
VVTLDVDECGIRTPTRRWTDHDATGRLVPLPAKGLRRASGHRECGLSQGQQPDTPVRLDLEQV